MGIRHSHQYGMFKLAPCAPICKMAIENLDFNFFLLTKNGKIPVKIRNCHFEAPVSEDGVIF